MGRELIIYVILLVMPVTGSALMMKSQMLKPRASAIEAENNLFDLLDLKSKTVIFGKKKIYDTKAKSLQTDVEFCGSNLERKSQTLTYSCSIPLESQARISRLQNLVTSSLKEIQYGAVKVPVKIEVARDARSVKFTATFDATGVDFDVLKFNETFFPMQAKTAQIVIAEAMTQPVRFEVLESR